MENIGSDLLTVFWIAAAFWKTSIKASSHWRKPSACCAAKKKNNPQRRLL